MKRNILLVLFFIAGLTCYDGQLKARSYGGLDVTSRPVVPSFDFKTENAYLAKMKSDVEQIRQAVVKTKLLKDPLERYIGLIKLNLSGQVISDDVQAAQFKKNNKEIEELELKIEKIDKKFPGVPKKVLFSEVQDRLKKYYLLVSNPKVLKGAQLGTHPCNENEYNTFRDNVVQVELEIVKGVSENISGLVEAVTFERDQCSKKFNQQTQRRYSQWLVGQMEAVPLVSLVCNENRLDASSSLPDPREANSVITTDAYNKFYDCVSQSYKDYDALYHGLLSSDDHNVVYKKSGKNLPHVNSAVRYIQRVSEPLVEKIKENLPSCPSGVFDTDNVQSDSDGFTSIFESGSPSLAKGKKILTVGNGTALVSCGLLSLIIKKAWDSHGGKAIPLRFLATMKTIALSPKMLAGIACSAAGVALHDRKVGLGGRGELLSGVMSAAALAGSAYFYNKVQPSASVPVVASSTDASSLEESIVQKIKNMLQRGITQCFSELDTPATT